MAEQWQKILENLVKKLDPSDFNVWITPLSAEITGHSISLRLDGATGFFVERFKKKMERVIREAAAEVFACLPMDVRLEVSGRPARPQSASPSPAPSPKAACPVAGAALRRGARPAMSEATDSAAPR
ncbi:MAG: hypothetical protein K6E40_10835, partial [Desulfovibrio sp.]|nr:hypothetical protein [Desulfovibrio sp.]